MSSLGKTISHALGQDNIDLILPDLLNAAVYVLAAESADGGEDFLLLPSPNKKPCLTAATDAGLLETALDAAPENLLVQMEGIDLLGLAEEDYEIMLVFPGGSHCLTRAVITRWFETYGDSLYPEDEEEDED